jgi:hypothetical protein
VYADTKPFVYNYKKRVVLLMVMEHAANKLFKKKKAKNIRDLSSTHPANKTINSNKGKC